MCRHYSLSGRQSRPPPTTADGTGLIACWNLCDYPRQRTRLARERLRYLCNFHAARDGPRAPRTIPVGAPGNYQVTLAGFDIVACLMTNN